MVQLNRTLRRAHNLKQKSTEKQLESENTRKSSFKRNKKKKVQEVSRQNVDLDRTLSWLSRTLYFVTLYKLIYSIYNSIIDYE